MITALFDPERFEHSGDIGDQFGQAIGFARLRTIGFAIAAVVGRDY
jgi:hypothetical protein